MPLSYQSELNPSSTTFTVGFEFISTADIKAVGKLNSASTWTELDVTNISTTNGTTTCTVADATNYSSNGEVRIYRSSPTSALVDFQNGSRLSESDLDTAYRQGLFAAQEVRENATEAIAGIGPQGPQGPTGADGQDGADGRDGQDGTSGGFLGDGQTWQDVFDSRAVNTFYTNNTGKPIQIFVVFGNVGTGADIKFCYKPNGGSEMEGAGLYTNSSSGRQSMTFTIPDGDQYKIKGSGAETKQQWWELR